MREDGDVEKTISPNFIVRNWSPAFTEWSTKAVREAFLHHRSSRDCSTGML